MREIRYALRALLRKPAFTLIAAVTLALGIGPNTILFSLVDAVLFQPLPFPQPERLVALWEAVPQKFRVAPANYLDWKNQTDAFQTMAAFGAGGFNLTEEGEPLQVQGVRADPDFFPVLGVKPLLGRLLTAADSEPDAAPVALLNERFWRDRFGSDPGIVGRSIRLDGSSYTVAGVVPSGPYPSWPTSIGKISFLLEHQRIFVPLKLGNFATNRRSHVFGVIARLAPDVSLAQAQNQMDAVAERLAQEYPEFNEGEGAMVTPLAMELTGDVRPALVILLSAVGLVLLIACANVGSLVMARSGARRREVAIRTAIGAGRGRLVRQFLVESLLLGLLGGALGVWVALVGLEAVKGLVPQKIPRLDQVAIDGRVLLFGLAAALISGLLVGLLPALRASSPDLLALRSGLALDGAGQRRGRKLAVVGQVALAFVLLFGSGLLIRTFVQLRRVDPGFRAQGVLVVDISLPSGRYDALEKIASFSRRLVEGISAAPGVESVAFGYDSPLAANWTDSYRIEGEGALSDREEAKAAQLRQVSPAYFETAGISLLRGRGFSALDVAEQPGVVVINQALADRDFPGSDPIGRRLSIGTPRAMWGEKLPASFEIVGVVGNVRFLGPAVEAEPAFYLPSGQFPLTEMSLLVRCASDPLALAPVVRRSAAELDPELPLAAVTTLESLLAERIAQPRFNMLLMGLFGGVALLLAAVGIFGLLSQTVAGRTHEIGVRMALGADRGRILWMVLGEGLVLTAAGLALGLALSLGLAQGFSNLLFQVSPTDPASCLLAALVLLAIALTACLIPAERAARIDPLRALRWE